MVTYHDGWLSDKGENEAKEWNDRTHDVYDMAQRSITNASMNNQKNQMYAALNNTSAYGGKLKKKNEDMLAYGIPRGFGLNANYGNTLFSIGGVMGGHGADWSNGVT